MLGSVLEVLRGSDEIAAEDVDMDFAWVPTSTVRFSCDPHGVQNMSDDLWILTANLAQPGWLVSESQHDLACLNFRPGEPFSVWLGL